VTTDERARAAVPYIADGDHVFRATAIGEHAFRKPSAPSPTD
jgi:hypothetical protein